MTSSARCASAIAFVWTIGLAAQARPDFTGRWTTDPDPAVQAAAPARGGGTGGQRGAGGGRGRAGDMGSGWGSTITIAQDATQLSVEYMFFTRGDMQPPLKFVYGLDGRETRNSVFMGRGRQFETSKTAWQGDRLVITTVHQFVNPDTGKNEPVEVVRTLSLESPASLVVETSRSGVMGGPSTSTRVVYRKL
jgi:hypothetical protein